MTGASASHTTTRSLPPFPEGWYLVATKRALSKTKLLQRTWMGREIVAWLDANEKICVADSLCPHMGAALGPDAGGSVVAGRLVCPFHGFEFGTDGQCVATPSGAPARAAKLYTYPVHDVEGLIFGWWGHAGRPPQWQLPESASGGNDWTDIQIRSIRFRGHPQETSENSVDIAHLSYVHGYSNVTHETAIWTEGPQLVSRFGFSTVRKLARVLRLKLDVAATAHLFGLGYSFVEFQELSIGIDARLWVCATPVDGELMDMTIVSQVRELHWPRRRFVGLAFLPQRMRAPILNKFIADVQMRDVRQDVTIWSRKHFVSRPLLAHSDGDILKYRKYCAQFYPEVPLRPTVAAPPPTLHG
ncbi:Rieske 2Fe-2S domain-containing protein [Candidatus Poriferisodalis sp.]|uniref:Rieske 2Fe-2S domain-containing protein n=1 Tax=Candidatus Poriferisodalis sp. TaxID=3101277 RepID=UPI003B017733